MTTSNGLTYPIAILTADEIALAGSGWGGTNRTSNHVNSYIFSSKNFWVLSPYRRDSGNIHIFVMSGNARYPGISSVNSYLDEYGVRPAISLASGTTATSGSGTAIDPWVVTAP